MKIKEPVDERYFELVDKKGFLSEKGANYFMRMFYHWVNGVMIYSGFDGRWYVVQSKYIRSSGLTFDKT